MICPTNNMHRVSRSSTLLPPRCDAGTLTEIMFHSLFQLPVDVVVVDSDITNRRLHCAPTAYNTCLSLRRNNHGLTAKPPACPATWTFFGGRSGEGYITVSNVTVAALHGVSIYRGWHVRGHCHPRQLPPPPLQLRRTPVMDVDPCRLLPLMVYPPVHRMIRPVFRQGCPRRPLD